MSGLRPIGRLSRCLRHQAERPLKRRVSKRRLTRACRKITWDQGPRAAEGRCTKRCTKSALSCPIAPTVADNRTRNLLILRAPVVAMSLDTEEVRGSSPPGPTICFNHFRSWNFERARVCVVRCVVTRVSVRLKPASCGSCRECRHRSMGLNNNTHRKLQRM